MTRDPRTGEQVPGDQATGDQATGDQTTGEQVPGDPMPGEQVPGDQATGDQTTGDRGETTRRPGVLAWIALFLIRCYQLTISPLLPRGMCRFEPSCSRYTAEAIRRYGFWKGGLKGAWRICRCNPFGGSGYDPP